MLPKPFLSSFDADRALDGHCRRVGALANLIAHELFLPTEEKEALHAACLRHHRVEEAADDNVRAILAAFVKPSRRAPFPHQLGAILRLADAFDQEFQSQPYEKKDASEILDALDRGISQGDWPIQVLYALRECTRPVLMPAPAEWRVPVFPQAAMRTLNVLRDPAASVSHVVEAAERDPATSGGIMQLANSALYGGRGKVSTLQAAVSRLGFDTARRVVTSLAMRPLLFLPRMENLWPHAIEVADLSAQLALRTAAIDPGEAYLAGLLHDVGRIALRATALYDAARLQGLEQSGCPAVYAEDLILRTDHAMLGAQIATMWHLPEPLIEAIRKHHRPEASTYPIAHLLYVSEHLAGSAEDLPSPLRLQHALDGIGLSAADVAKCTPSDVVGWLAAA